MTPPSLASIPNASLSPAGEFELKHEDFKKIAAILHADAGIHLSDAKTNLVYARLAKRLRLLGLESFRDYCELIVSSEGRDERQNMIAALTTNVTRFFREMHHFDHLKRQVLPPLLAAARKGGRLRIWSARMFERSGALFDRVDDPRADERRGELRHQDLATDIDPNMIAVGVKGIYPRDLLAEIPNDLLRRWFEPAPDGDKTQLQASDALRSLIAFRELNIHGAWPMKQRFNAIFCRNVMIYFEVEAQARIWARFVPQLHPGGSLYIGHSERLSGEATDLFQSEGVTTYRLGEAV